MINYSIFRKEEGARIELHDKLSLTGSEISIDTLPGNTSVPFIHAHKQNEEVYYIVEGNGKIVIDDEDVLVNAGDFVKINPEANRQIFAFENGIKYICIQTKKDSLEEFTAGDAIIKWVFNIIIYNNLSW